jgi:hypothetical protein
VAPMKRILLLVTVALVMAAMMVATAAPALSVPQEQPPPPQAAGPNCQDGQTQAADNHFKNRAKHLENAGDCEEGDTPGEGFD